LPGFLHPEEWAIAATLIIAVVLCYWTGTGFEWNRPFLGYLGFFGQYGLYLFLCARLVHVVRVRWKPKSRVGQWTFQKLGGHLDPGELMWVDLEFLRGLFVLLVTITVYTNFKVRIPFLNSAVGDQFFQTLDNLILGRHLVPWIESTVSHSAFWTYFFNRIYFHDFVWMIFLVAWFWMRNDRKAMRWIFASFCLIYMVAIFATAIYPSFGPFFVDFKRFGWVASTPSGQVQVYLVRRFVENMDLVHAGKLFPTPAFTGIAAFPSLHVGYMVMIVVIGWASARIYSIAMIGVTVLTTISTLAFGWHYFVDVLSGGLIALAVPLVIRPWIYGRRSAESDAEAAEVAAR